MINEAMLGTKEDREFSRQRIDMHHDPPKIKRVLVLGYGYWGRKVAAALRTVGGEVLVADSSREACKEAEADGFQSYPSFEAALESKPEGVAIVTPPLTHARMVWTAQDAGLHVFVEKPAFLAASTGYKARSVAIHKHLGLQVGHIYLHCPGMLHIPRTISRPMRIEVKLWNVRGAPSRATRDLLTAGMPHAISIVVAYMGVKDYSLELRKCEEDWVIAELTYEMGKAVLDIRDWSGERHRGVSIQVEKRRWLFNADRPNELILTSDRGTEHVDFYNDSWGKTPLEMEMSLFLAHPELYNNQVGAHARLLRQIMEAVKKERGT
jgi:predicted dehydrogenase